MTDARPTTISTERADLGELGRYRLCAELAAGGMATVFLSSTISSAGFSKVVALKRIHEHLARDARFVDMFLDEARVASRITHPNVCSVFDFGAVESTYFIAMEYLMGETFSSIQRSLRERGRTEWTAHLAEIFAQAAEGLHAAHELRGDDGGLLDVVHRDVSPQNLFLTYDGCVKVVDFGVARCAGRIQETEPGTIKGKLAYIAPEQMRCQEVDRRSDVWSLGVTFWEMLVGRQLFKRGSDIETLQAVLSAEIPAPSSLNPTVPPALDLIVLKALSRDVSARWQTARDMSRALRDFNRAERASLGQVELEEWMLELFPLQYREKRALVQAARERSDPTERIPVGEAIESAEMPLQSSGAHALSSPSPAISLHERISTTPTHAGSMSPDVPGAPHAFWAGVGFATTLAVMLGGWILALTWPATRFDEALPAALATGATHLSVPIPSVVPPPMPVVPATPSEEPTATTLASTTTRSRQPTPRPGRSASRGSSRGGERTGDDVEQMDATDHENPEVEEAIDQAPAAVPAETPAAPEPPVLPATIAPSSLDARVSIDALRTGGSIPTSAVRQAIERLEDEYQRCYRNAAQRAQRDASGTVDVGLTIDEMGLPQHVSVGSGALPGLSECVQDVTSRLRTRLRPDTGTADVSYGVRYTVRGGAR
ncbi:protein kinase domain-containing protein [Sandaracinus amylolyticus]|uniref:protein kinase domain-containing protein n=1 Tax=Sandaracinus amylolyticus TaxID=927083 RepID=UPI001F39AFDE|nr:protein kinase [Sandaracinus amylolyticus]UJR83289.1 Hypothetical protein I5071_53570 [Sandaracinus amylolyticus]